MEVNKEELRRLAEAARELRADIESVVAYGEFKKAASPAAILSLLDENDQLRAENERLRAQLAESQANDRTAMGYLAEVRAAVGGDDFPAMVRSVQALRKDAERLDSGCIITDDRNEFGEDYQTERRGINLRASIDAAMAKEAIDNS